LKVQQVTVLENLVRTVVAVDLDSRMDIPVARKENSTLRMIMAVLGFCNEGLAVVLCDKMKGTGDGGRLVGRQVDKHGEGNLNGGSIHLWDSMDFEEGVPLRTGHRRMVHLSSAGRREEVRVVRWAERDHTGERDGD
jgi:hypothetical protein